jgi:hypothetical protein
MHDGNLERVVFDGSDILNWMCSGAKTPKHICTVNAVYIALNTEPFEQGNIMTKFEEWFFRRITRREVKQDYDRKMTRFERWFLKRVIREEVRQGYDHDARITGLYRMIREACEKEFTEDNEPTLSDFLSDCFEDTQKWPFGRPPPKQLVSGDTN